MAKNKPSLTAAYALETPEDNRALYADWAETYDAGFVQDMDYQMPAHVAGVFREMFSDQGPVLDVGAGTGVLGEVLEGMTIDGLDISAEMLAMADRKGVYRQTMVGDLTGILNIANASYAGVISSGTFTHGHVGPNALDELMRVAQSGAAFALGINAEHFESRGFAAKLAVLEPHICDLTLHDVRIYGDKASDGHKDDRALVAAFFKR